MDRRGHSGRARKYEIHLAGARGRQYQVVPIRGPIEDTNAQPQLDPSERQQNEKQRRGYRPSHISPQN